MIAQFSMVPVGAGTSLSEKIACIADIIDKSGLDYRLTAMGTIVEGSWEEVMSLLKLCRDEVMKSCDRVYITVAIDERKDKSGRITGKTDAVENRLGRQLKK
ncbi:MAG: MTH1187 family thiamine-binding protein [Nitrospiraceae bacterium]|nr:MTH1187 family thiamine-binding protein [Nitrospiraceae bacterium]